MLCRAGQEGQDIDKEKGVRWMGVTWMQIPEWKLGIRSGCQSPDVCCAVPRVVIHAKSAAVWHSYHSRCGRVLLSRTRCDNGVAKVLHPPRRKSAGVGGGCESNACDRASIITTAAATSHIHAVISSCESEKTLAQHRTRRFPRVAYKSASPMLHGHTYKSASVDTWLNSTMVTHVTVVI